MGDAAIPSLVNALRHDEWLVRLHAVESLGKTKSPQAVEPLLSVLFNDQDSAIREDAVRALGKSEILGLLNIYSRPCVSLVCAP